MRTVYEWKISDVGYAWINAYPYPTNLQVDGLPAADYTVMFDPEGWFEVGRSPLEGNIIANEQEACNATKYNTRIAYILLSYWKSMGSPIYDAKAPGYVVPRLDWKAAGFDEDPAVSRVPAAWEEED